MSDDLRRFAERLERDLAGDVNTALGAVAHRAAQRARRRQVVIGSTVAVFVIVVAAAIVNTAADRPEGVPIVDAADTPASTTVGTPTSTTGRVAAAEKFVATDFASGWTAVYIGEPDLEYGWVPSALLNGPTVATGDVMETYSPAGELVGYYLRAAGYVPRDTFESARFDWRTFIEDAHRNDPAFVEQTLAAIDAAGGLGSVQTAEMAGFATCSDARDCLSSR